MTKYLISVVGPTAIGKTSLSIKLAGAFNTEILSADSRQFYKEMQIGTAAPTPEELAAAPHHFIQHRSIQDPYTVGDFERDAIKEMEKLFRDRDILILAGGSGLYVKSILEGLDDFPEVDPEIRETLNARVQENGLEPLQEELEQLDPETFDRIDTANPHRLIRALEICLGTGKTYSSFLNKQRNPRDFEVIKIGLTAPREVIYERINRRVDIMIAQGLVEEVRQLYPHKNLNALNTVGYKEMFTYLDGELSLENAIEEIKKNTRRFAKRQLTWFRKEQDIAWFDYTTPVEEILSYIRSKTLS